MRVEHSGDGIFGRRSHNAKLFERIEHSGSRLGIIVNKRTLLLLLLLSLHNTLKIPLANVVRLLAEWSETKSNVKTGFDPGFERPTCLATLKSSAWWKETSCGWQYIYRLFGLVRRVFANGPGDLGSIPDRVILKTLKMVLDTSLLNTQQYKVRIKGKWSNPEKNLAPSPTFRCSSYWKGSLLVTLDYCRQLYFYFIYIYIYIYILWVW